MSLWGCADCSTAYAVGSPACPHCRSTNREDDMPKINSLGIPSHAADIPEPAPAPEPARPSIPEEMQAQTPQAPADEAPKAPAKKAAAPKLPAQKAPKV